jgi:predicted small secreted protein
VKVLYLLALILMGFAMSACHTTRGVGQDIEATGDAIEGAADDAMDDDR